VPVAAYSNQTLMDRTTRNWSIIFYYICGHGSWTTVPIERI